MDSTERAELHGDLGKHIFGKKDWRLVSAHAHVSLVLCPSHASGRVHSDSQRKGRIGEDREVQIPSCMSSSNLTTISSVLPWESVIDNSAGDKDLWPAIKALISIPTYFLGRQYEIRGKSTICGCYLYTLCLQERDSLFKAMAPMDQAVCVKAY